VLDLAGVQGPAFLVKHRNQVIVRKAVVFDATLRCSERDEVALAATSNCRHASPSRQGLPRRTSYLELIVRRPGAIFWLQMENPAFIFADQLEQGTAGRDTDCKDEKVGIFARQSQPLAPRFRLATLLPKGRVDIGLAFMAQLSAQRAECLAQVDKRFVIPACAVGDAELPIAFPRKGSLHQFDRSLVVIRKSRVGVE
jgi:hypothetical protein